MKTRDQKKVYEAVSYRPMSTDEIAVDLGMSTDRVLSVLSYLKSKNKVVVRTHIRGPKKWTSQVL